MKNKSKKASIVAAALVLSLGFGASAYAAGTVFGPAPAGGPSGNMLLESVEDNTDDSTTSNSDTNRPTPPAKPNGDSTTNSDTSMPTPPAKPDGQSENGTNTQDGRKGGHGGIKELIEKINKLEDGDTKEDLLEKAEAAEEAMKEFMDAAKEAGLVETPPEKPTKEVANQEL